DRFSPHPGGRGSRPGLPLGHGELPLLAAAGGAGGLGHLGDPPGDPARPGPGQRRHDEPLRCPPVLDGHLWLRLDQGVPEGRDRHRPGHHQRGQAPAAPAGSGPGGLSSMPPPSHSVPAFDTVLVVDFGAQYAQLIARRVRECRVRSEIVPASISAEEVRRRSPKGIILSGGPRSVYEPGAHRADPGIFGLGIPVLGICYGHQLMAKTLGGDVARAGTGEFGRTAVSGGCGLLFEGLAATQTAWMSHNDAVVAPPEGFRATATSPASPVAAMEDPERGLLRAGEAEQVVDTFGGHLSMNLVHIKAADRFLERLAGVEDPERKRTIIGNEFIRVFEEAALEIAGDSTAAPFLVQGTLYPDVIESGGSGGVAARIKTHHNVGGLPDDMAFE